MIQYDEPKISIRRQCEMLDLSRSGLYYAPQGISEYNLLLMKLLDEQHTKTPFYGVLKMQKHLERLGHHVNEKRVRRLMHLMGLETIYAKPNLSKPNKDHKIFPYLLRGMEIEKVNHVWSTDITYIRLQKGFVYLVAIIDWFSRYVIDWQISTSLDADFCIETLNRALKKGSCDIFNTDQGAQFTTPRFTDILLENNIRVSMDGRGRALDNIFVERLWRSLKYEMIYLVDIRNLEECLRYIDEYFKFYNIERMHQSLGYKTPHEIYFG